MKLTNFALENPVYIEDDKAFVLVAEDPAFFTSLTGALYSQCNGKDGDWILSQGKEIALSKNAVVISDYFSLNINDRKLLSRVAEQLKSVALSENNVESTYNILNAVSLYLQGLTADTDYPVVVGDVEVSQLLKAVDISFENAECDLTGKLTDYVSVFSNLMAVKLLICVNLKSYLTAAQLNEFYMHCFNNGMKLLLIENAVREKQANETVLVSDCDLCEYFL